MDALSQILQNGKEVTAATVDAAHALELARAAFSDPHPRYDDAFRKAEALTEEFSLPHESALDVVHTICRQFAMQSWREPAWALSCLYYDQVFKYGVANQRRQHLGNSLFGIAKLASDMGHFAGARHHAALALIADILWEHRLENLALGAGAAVHTFANHSDWATAEALVSTVRRQLASPAWRHGDVTPIHPESLLVAWWFPTREMGVIESAAATSGLTLLDRLLSRLDSHSTKSRHEKGVDFEAAVALLLDVTPGFEVRGGFANYASQIDVVATYRRHAGANAFLPEGYVLVECKNWEDKVDGAVIDRLGRECKTTGAAFGILAARNGITGEALGDRPLRDAQARRVTWRDDGVHILVLTLSDLRQAAHRLNALEPFLKRDFERLHFGERG